MSESLLLKNANMTCVKSGEGARYFDANNQPVVVFCKNNSEYMPMRFVNPPATTVVAAAKKPTTFEEYKPNDVDDKLYQLCDRLMFVGERGVRAFANRYDQKQGWNAQQLSIANIDDVRPQGRGKSPPKRLPSKPGSTRSTRAESTATFKKSLETPYVKLNLDSYPGPCSSKLGNNHGIVLTANPGRWRDVTFVASLTNDDVLIAIKRLLRRFQHGVRLHNVDHSKSRVTMDQAKYFRNRSVLHHLIEVGFSEPLIVFSETYTASTNGAAESCQALLRAMSRCARIARSVPKDLWDRSDKQASRVLSIIPIDRIASRPSPKEFAEQKPVDKEYIKLFHPVYATIYKKHHQRRKYDITMRAGWYLGIDEQSPGPVYVQHQDSKIIVSTRHVHRPPRLPRAVLNGQVPMTTPIPNLKHVRFNVPPPPPPRLPPIALQHAHGHNSGEINSDGDDVLDNSDGDGTIDIDIDNDDDDYNDDNDGDGTIDLDNDDDDYNDDNDGDNDGNDIDYDYDDDFEQNDQDIDKLPEYQPGIPSGLSYEQAPGEDDVIIVADTQDPINRVMTKRMIDATIDKLQHQATGTCTDDEKDLLEYVNTLQQAKVYYTLNTAAKRFGRQPSIDSFWKEWNQHTTNFDTIRTIDKNAMPNGEPIGRLLVMWYEKINGTLKCRIVWSHRKQPAVTTSKFETSSQVPRPEDIRLLLSLDVESEDDVLRTADAPSAYSQAGSNVTLAYGQLDRYVAELVGHVDGTVSVGCLNGRQQAGLWWQQHRNERMAKHGYIKPESQSSTFIGHGARIIIGTDDFLCRSTAAATARFEKVINTEFGDCKPSTATEFFNLRITKLPNGFYEHSTEPYIDRALTDHDPAPGNKQTPMPSGVRVLQSDRDVQPNQQRVKEFQIKFGTWCYASTQNRFDIQFCCSQLGKVLVGPKPFT